MQIGLASSRQAVAESFALVETGGIDVNLCVWSILSDFLSISEGLWIKITVGK